MKLRILLVLTLCAIMLVGGVACKAGSSYGGMTAEQIIQNMEAATLNYSSVHMDMTMTMSGTIQESLFNKFTINAVANMSGDMDAKNKSVYVSEAVTMDMTADGEAENYTMNVQVYMLDSWMYMEMDMPGETRWMKMEFPDELWEQQQSSMLQYEALLKDTIEINVVGEEAVNGVACWKLDIKPDWERLFDWAETQMEDMIGDMPEDMPSGAEISQMFKNVNLKMWIAKDTYYPVRFDETMIMDIEGVTMNIVATAYYSKFNQPVTITLPAEALEAEEMTY